jgi:hypothetical protein
MDISKQLNDKIAKKPLGELAWIEAGDIKIRFDYMTQSQEIEFYRLANLWGSNLGEKGHSHHFDYLLRATVKDVVGITYGEQPMALTFKNGLANEFVTNEPKEEERKHYDLVRCFFDLEILTTVCSIIFSRIEMTEADKKKLQSALDSVKKENSQEQSQTSPPVES